MAEQPVSIRAVRAHASSLWRALMQASLPPTWVPIPVKRALVEAVIASLMAILSSSRIQARIRTENVYRTAKLLGLDGEEYAPKRGEKIIDWFERVVARKDGEPPSAWLNRATKACMAVLAHIRGLTLPMTDIISMIYGEEAAEETLM